MTGVQTCALPIYIFTQPFTPKNKVNNLLNAKPGDIADDTLYVYPPGIPIITSGEIYTEEIINEINDYYSKGYKIKSNKGFATTFD